MRGHAKAPSTGSSKGQAGGFGRFAVIPFAISTLLLLLGAGNALAAAPTVSGTTASAVGTTTAVLEGDVNPQGEATSYHFEYGLADCSANPCTSIPVLPAGLGSGTKAIRVAKEVIGLQSGSTYHFRLVASNGSGTIEGPDRTFTTYEPFVPETDCPNQAVRYGPSANLPNCRAYEMVSPVDKDGGEVLGSNSSLGYDLQHQQSAVDGNGFTFTSFKSFGDQASGAYSNQYLARRGPEGWSTHGLNPFQTPNVFGGLSLAMLDIDVQAFTPDLSSHVVMNYNKHPLTPDGLDGYINLYRRYNTTGEYEALTNAGPFGPTGVDLGPNGNLFLRFKGDSDDLSHQVFQAAAALTPDAKTGGVLQVYDLHDGQLELVNILPNDETAPAASVGSSFAGGSRNGSIDNAVSNDGSRIFWTAVGSGGGSGALYVRIDGQTTVPVSGSVDPGDAQFWTASSNGSKAVFSMGNHFNGAADLYEFDVATETPSLIAGESWGVAGASDDASSIYFVSEEVRDTGATAGEPNLYLYQEGSYNFVATVAESDVVPLSKAGGAYSLAAPSPMERATRVTPDGGSIAFNSVRSLTGYDNTDAQSGEPDAEVFVYDAEVDQLACASCNPSGVRPNGRRMFGAYQIKRDFFETNTWAAAWLPTWEWEFYDSHALSDDGNRVFFNSFDALLPRDTNGVQDVYQWEAEGSSGCQKPGGCISLISTGTSPTWSEFSDATPSGDDVFFRTASSIDPNDPGLIDVYDARVGGGYPQPVPPTPCVGDACQNVPAPPNDPTPASASFRGASDPTARTTRRRCGTNRKRAAKRSKAGKRARQCRRANRRANR